MISKFIIRCTAFAIGYTLCYYFWWLSSPNTEFIATVVFFLLQMLMLMSVNIENDSNLSIVTFPFTMPKVKHFFFIGWGLLFTATAILIYVFQRLHSVFNVVGKPIRFGNNGNRTKLNILKRFLTATSVMLLLLYILMAQKIEQFDRIVTLSGSNAILFFLIATIAMGSCSVYYANDFNNITRIVTTDVGNAM